MKAHDDIVAACEEYVPYWFETRKEFNVWPGRSFKADLVAFDGDTRRPVMVVEVKPSLKVIGDITAAVNQVDHYARCLVEESPHARVLPVVVAANIAKALDAREFTQDAVVWTLEMFCWAMQDDLLYKQRDIFHSQHPDGFGPTPITFREHFVGFRSPYLNPPSWVQWRREERAAS